MARIVRKAGNAREPGIHEDAQGRKVALVKIEGRYAQLIAGDITVEDLDDEEIIRGRLRDKNGGWSGRPPKLVPREFLEAIQAERPKRIQAMLDAEIPHAFKALHDVMVGGTANKGGGAKVAAATKILEYAIGKPSEQVNLKIQADDKRWEDILPRITYDLPAEEQIIDAEEA